MHTPPTRRGPWTALVFGGALVALLGVQARQNPAWVPRGADWDSWIWSAMALRADLPYPMSRWPLYGALVAALDAVLGQPVFVAATAVSVLATAGLAALVAHLTHRLFGAPAALATAGLTLAFPLTLELGLWANGYALWSASAALGVAALAGLADTGRPREALLAGLGIGGTLAVMDKGLGVGLGLAALAALVVVGRALAADRGERLRGLASLGGAALAPVLALALGYRAFDPPLASLDSQAHITTISPLRPGQVPPAAHQRAVEGLRTEGYVFGRSMGPGTLLRTARLAGTPGPERAARQERSARLLTESFPGLAALGPWPWVGGGAALLAGALLAWRRQGPGALVGVLGVGVVAAGVTPALAAETLQLRFLAPGLAWLPLGLLGPVALFTHRTRGLRWAPVGVALALGLGWEAGPWQQRDPVLGHMATGGGELAARLRYWLDRALPGEVVHVADPVRGGLFLLEDRGGRVLEGPHPQLPVEGWVLLWVPGQLDPARLVGQPAAALPQLPASAGERTIANLFTQDPVAGWLVLLTPPGQAPPGWASSGWGGVNLGRAAP